MKTPSGSTAFAFALALFSADANAQPASAATLFSSGDTALGRRNYAGALRDCQAAAMLLQSAPREQLGRAQFCVAQAARGLEQWATALDAATAAVRNIEQGTALQARYASDLRRAREMVREVTPRVPRITITIEPPAARAGLTVTINGEAVDAALIGRPLARDPGPQTIVAEAPGFAPAREVHSLATGESHRVVLRLTAGDATATRRGVSPLVWVGGAVALGAGAVALVLGVDGSSRLGSYTDRCRQATFPAECATAQHETQRSLDGQAIATNVALGVMGAGLVVAVIGIVRVLGGGNATAAAARANVSFDVGPHGVALRGRW